MGSFLQSLFSFGKEENPAGDSKNRNFDILKFDGIKALKIGKNTYAIRCFQEAMAIEEDPEILNFLAIAYTQNGDKEEAVDTYSKLIDMNPELTDVRLRQAKLYFTLDRFNETIAECKYILDKEGDEYQTLLLLAQAYNASGQPEAAILPLSAAIELGDGNHEALLLRAEIYFKSEKYQPALDDTCSLLSGDPENESGFLLQAKIYRIQQEITAALQNYDAVLEINPFHETAYLEKAKLLLEEHKANEALLCLDEAIENIHESAKLFRLRGEIRQTTGDNQGAKSDLQESERIDSEEQAQETVDFSGMYKNRPL